MSEERKPTNAALTDEEIEKAAGGSGRGITRNVTCPSCQFAYSFETEEIRQLPPDCPNCGYVWSMPDGPIRV